MHDAWLGQGSVLRLRFRCPHDFSFNVRCFRGRGCRSGGMGALDFDMLPEVTDIPNLLPRMPPEVIYTCIVCTYMSEAARNSVLNFHQLQLKVITGDDLEGFTLNFPPSTCGNWIYAEVE